MADQHNSNIPAMGNQISSDIPDIKENLEFHKDIFENFINAWSATDASGIYPVTMGDADADTLIQLEESADEDTIRFDCGGTEIATIDGTNKLKVDTINELTGGTGVTIDGVLLQDSSIAAAAIPSGAITEARLASSAVSQAKLKTSTQEVSTSSTSQTRLSVSNAGSYGFYPQVKGSQSNNTVYAQICGSQGGAVYLGTSYVTVVAMYVDAGTGYAQFRYVSSSGELYWLFFLVDKQTKKTISATAGPDHPCFGNSGKPNLHQHPFLDYDESKHEIYVFNPSPKQLEEFRNACFVDDDDTPDRSILQIINEDYELDFSQSPQWPNIPVTVKIENDDWNNPKEAKIIQKIIPKPDHIKTVGLRKK